MDKWAIIAESLRLAGYKSPDEPEHHPAICCISGLHTDHTYRRKDILSSGFTDYDKIASSTSDRVGIDAATVLKTPETRRKSWRAVMGKPIEWLDKPMVLQTIQKEPPKDPWVGYVTFAGKKHGSLRAPLNIETNIWQVEERETTITDQTPRLLTLIQELREYGCSKAAILSLEIPTKILAKIKLHHWIQMHNFLYPHLETSLLRLLVWAID